mgnify:CR=1 FL=1
MGSTNVSLRALIQERLVECLRGSFAGAYPSVQRQVDPPFVCLFSVAVVVFISMRFFWLASAGVLLSTDSDISNHTTKSDLLLAFDLD